ncbi:MAG: hypothetical protein IJ568_04040 [Bacilli bacterium]|nr:hypothetical protein [Bacilli bacterium]
MRKVYKEIPRKNYVKITLIFALTLLISTIIFVSYNNYIDYLATVPKIRGYVPEIELKDLDAYMMENQDFMLYMGKAPDDNSSDLEEDLIELIETRGISFVYMNISNVEDEKFYKEFNEKYGNGFELFSYPAFVAISNGKVVDMVQREYYKLFIPDVTRLINRNETKGENND